MNCIRRIMYLLHQPDGEMSDEMLGSVWLVWVAKVLVHQVGYFLCSKLDFRTL